MSMMLSWHLDTLEWGQTGASKAVDITNVNPIITDKLNEVLVSVKNKKTPGCNDSDAELFKYASENLKMWFLKF